MVDALLQPYGGFAQIIRVDGGNPAELIRLDPQLSSIVVDYSNFEPAYSIKADSKNPAREIRRIMRSTDLPPKKWTGFKPILAPSRPG